MVELTREKLEKINDLVGNHGWAKPVLDDLEIPFEQRLELVDFTYNQLRSIAAGENGESREDVEIAKARVRELLLGFIERDVYDSGCLIDFFHATNSQNFFYLNDRDEQCIYRKDITSEIKKIAYAKWLVLCWEEIDEFTDYKLANHRYVYLKRWVGRFTFGKMRLRKLAYAKWEEIVRTSIGSVETLTEVRDLYLYNLDLKSLRQTILEKWEEIVLGELSKIATLEQFKTLYGLSPENSQARDVVVREWEKLGAIKLKEKNTSFVWIEELVSLLPYDDCSKLREEAYGLWRTLLMDQFEEAVTLGALKALYEKSYHFDDVKKVILEKMRDML